MIQLVVLASTVRVACPGAVAGLRPPGDFNPTVCQSLEDH